MLGDFRRHRCAQHGAAAFDIKIVVKFNESRQQIGLGEQQVDRHGDFKRLAQFHETAAHQRGMTIQPGAIRAEQFIDADCHDHPVDR